LPRLRIRRRNRKQAAATAFAAPRLRLLRRNRKNFTATAFRSPQLQNLRRNRKIYTATPFTSPQPKNLCRNHFYFTATAIRLPQPEILHRNSVYFTATAKTSPQPRKSHRNRKRPAATPNALPQLRILGACRECYPPAAAGSPQSGSRESSLPRFAATPADFCRPEKGRPVLSAKLSVEEVLSQLEARAAALRAEEASHAEQEALHKRQRESCAAELEKVLTALESFRSAAADAVPFAEAAGAKPKAKEVPEKLPPPGRLMVSRLLRLAIESPDLPEPFGATAVAAEANRRFANRLRELVAPRTASDVLRRMLGEGKLELVRKGKAQHEAIYRRKG
jgi:hypothetical protein